jgi:putative FmdB family regulatory protein
MYRCGNCGFQFEHRQKFSDDPLEVCPECEESALRKVYLPVGIVFKGSGFYSTDNRSSSRLSRAGTKSEADEKPTTEKSSDEKTSSTDSKKKGSNKGE